MRQSDKSKTPRRVRNKHAKAMRRLLKNTQHKSQKHINAKAICLS